MPFPDVPRVIYAKNPLIRVICQLRFPPILKIDSEIPANYQDRIRDNYPFYHEKSLAEPPIEIKDQLPSEIAKLMIDSGGKKHEFISVDEQWVITLTKEFIALTAQEYTRWEEFIDHLQSPLEVFVNEYNPSFYSRIGLRYQNVIQRSVLGLQDVRWSELLKPYIAGVLSATDIDEGFVREVVHSEVIGLKDGDEHSQVRIVHRFVTEQKNDELCYLIDNDFFTEQSTEIENAIETLNYFNRRARRLFQWCISERLHEAMGPEQI